MGKNCTPKERLTRVETKLDILIEHFTNHLHTHRQILLTCLGVGLTGTLSLICWLAAFIWKIGH